MDLIAYPDFERVDIRVGTVVSAAPNPAARSKAQGAGTREPSARRQKLPQVARRTLTHNPT